MIKIVQHGCGLLGQGETLAEAIDDAGYWGADPAPTMAFNPARPIIGQTFACDDSSPHFKDAAGPANGCI